MKLNLKRIFRHLTCSRARLRQAFPHATLMTIEHEIAASEALHDGEIRFAVELALSGTPLYFDQSARERAIDLFSDLRMWDTENRNGVLIYLLMADRSVEIVVDRGVNLKAGEQAWQRICHAMEAAYHDKLYLPGTLNGIREVNQILVKYFPKQGTPKNELPDKVIVL